MKIDEILDGFSTLDQWDDRYRYVIELGRGLAPLPEALRTDANKVQGCASQVWLGTDVKPNGSDGPGCVSTSRRSARTASVRWSRAFKPTRGPRLRRRREPRWPIPLRRHI